MSIISRVAYFGALLCCIYTMPIAFAEEQMIEHEAACTKESVNEKGWTTIEPVPCPPGKQKTIEQIQREEDAVLQHKCGKDYQRLRVGMKLSRLEDCVGATYETETVTEKGRIETYRTTFDWVHVKNGVVVGFTKRTD